MHVESVKASYRLSILFLSAEILSGSWLKREMLILSMKEAQILDALRTHAHTHTHTHTRTYTRVYTYTHTHTSVFVCVTSRLL